jgi:hypothetical protein
MNMTRDESPSEQLIDALDALGDSLNKIDDESELVLGENSEAENVINNQQVDQRVAPESNLLAKLKRSLGIKSG